MTNDPQQIANQELDALMMKRLSQIETAMATWANKQIEIDYNPAGTDLFSILELSHSYAKRCVDLAEGIKLLVKAQRIVPASILARSYIETVAIGTLFIDEIQSLISKGEFDKIRNRLERFFAGYKGTDIEPIHIMDGMRYLDKLDQKYLSELEDKTGFIKEVFSALESIPNKKSTDQSYAKIMSVMNSYNKLSEIAHPNGTGTQFLYAADNAYFEKVGGNLKYFQFSCFSAIWQGRYLLQALESTESFIEAFRVFAKPKTA